MTERERLMELLKDNSYLDVLDDEHWELAAEQLLANGVIVPPVKAGDTIWFELYKEIESAVIYSCRGDLTQRGLVLTEANAKTSNGIEVYFCGNNIGKTVFLTKEEAERELERRYG